MKAREPEPRMGGRNMIKIVADDNIPYLKGALEPYASINYMDGGEIVPVMVKHADALLIRTRTQCNESLLYNSRVKFIGTATIGLDHIDTVYCHSRSIRYANAPGCNAVSVQQYIASVLANLKLRYGVSLSGKTIGIIGVGNVGKRVEKLARQLGMKVLLNDPPRARIEGNTGFVTLEKFLKESDIVTLHVPLNRSGKDKTVHLISHSNINFFKPGSWLINTARGEVADENVLMEGLSDKRLAGVVLDVWDNEPSIDKKLIDKATFATPHIAGYSADGKRNGTIQVVRSLGDYFGLPLNDWEPAGIPEPRHPIIALDCTGKSLDELACEAILDTYDIRDDDYRFRLNPGKFEELRGNYPLRREFPAYKIKLVNDNSNIKAMFLGLGFSVI